MIYIVSDILDGKTNLSCDHFPKSSIEKVLNNLDSIGYRSTYFGGVNELINAYNNHCIFNSDIVFLNMSDGLYQKSRRMQAPVMFELLGVKYTGSNPFATGLMNNKFFSKQAAISCGIKTPKSIIINSYTSTELIGDFIDLTKSPYIVKPNGEGSSIGIDNNSIGYDYETILHLIQVKLREFDEVLVEEYIPGTDASTLIVGNGNQLLINETLIYKTNGEFILNDTVRDTYVKENWISDGYIIESLNDYKDLSFSIKKYSHKLFNYIGCNDIARLDYRISIDGNIYFLEINSMPTITPTSDVGMICQGLNKPYSYFLKSYIETAFTRLKINHG